MLSFMRPLIVSGLGTTEQTCRPLTRVAFGSSAKESGYDEAWLQALLQEHPALLPVEAVEPALTPLVPICRERAADVPPRWEALSASSGNCPAAPLTRFCPLPSLTLQSG